MKKTIQLTESNVRQLVMEAVENYEISETVEDLLKQNPNMDENELFNQVVNILGIAPCDFDKVMEIIGEVQACVANGIEDDGFGINLNEDMTRGQVESAIEDAFKGKEFEKRVNNIVVDTVGDFLESMWTKKSFWKTMLKRK